MTKIHDNMLKCTGWDLLNFVLKYNTQYLPFQFLAQFDYLLSLSADILGISPNSNEIKLEEGRLFQCATHQLFMLEKLPYL